MQAAALQRAIGAKQTGVVVKKRDGQAVEFDETRIAVAIEKAFRAEMDTPAPTPLPDSINDQISEIVRNVVAQVVQRSSKRSELNIEEIQDQVELQLMRFGHYAVARRYIVYREERAKARQSKREDSGDQPIVITLKDGRREELNVDKLKATLDRACSGLNGCSPEAVYKDARGMLYNLIQEAEVDRALILAARTHIEREPNYSKATARLLLDNIYREVLGVDSGDENLGAFHREGFDVFIRKGIKEERLSRQLELFDLRQISQALKPERDLQFQYMGLQTLYDRYLLHVGGKRIETPQYFWMRVAMGLALNEGLEREARAIEFYNLLSSFRFVSSSPTLFNAGTPHPQLSSCYLSTTSDDLQHIFKVIADNAALSKWAGGIGNDWTNVRATGATIKGTNGASQGIIPFLKVANDTAIAVNQGGKRKGAVCAYLETWHLEIEEFCELRKNTGDERRRTHDMHLAHWIPDLFMKRVQENSVWTLFSPNEVPDLHDLYGRAFEARYKEYEAKADRGEIANFKKVSAVELWRKMLSMAFETGHPWLTWKDPSNIRSPQDHVGVVHSSNLCTEILLPTSETETAVCNLGSINLAEHMTSAGLNEAVLRDTMRTAIRMLDNVIDLNYYPTIEARNSNLKHRPIGLGLMGFQDALYMQHIPYDSEAAIEFADRSMELISYYALLASSDLARERGSYPSYRGSKWHRGLLPLDTNELLRRERGGNLDVDTSTTLNWNVVREAIALHGMRNSNVMAIAPTATIANITGITQSIEPTYRNLYVKSNLSGEFTVINPFLVSDLQKLGLWDKEMIDDLKYFDGVVSQIEKIPAGIKALYKTAGEIEPMWLIEAASRRQKWIDMGQSLNLYIQTPSGKLLNDMYMLAWRKGLKTTYYLRSVAATQVEKSSLDINKRGIQPRWMKNASASSEIVVDRPNQETPLTTQTEAGAGNKVEPKVKGKFCDPNDDTCDACQ